MAMLQLKFRLLLDLIISIIYIIKTQKIEIC